MTNNNPYQITFAPQVQVEQVKTIAQQGYKAVLCNRPDHEEAIQPTIAEIGKACQEQGLHFASIPFSGGQFTQQDVEDFVEFVKNADKPLYIYCRTGNRSQGIYQYALQHGLL